MPPTSTRPESPAPAPTTGGRKTRAEIVATALEFFTDHGYEGTSLQQIADRLHMTKAGLYHHFRSKDDLLLAVLEPYLADVDEMVAGHDPDAPLPTPDEAGAAIEGYLDFLLRHRRVLSYLARDAGALSRPEVLTKLTRFYDLISEVVRGADLHPADRIKVNFALGGMQEAIVLNATTPAEELRGPILEAVLAVLEQVERPAGT